MSEAASLVEVYTLCRVNMPLAYLREVARTQKYKFCGSDPMHCLEIRRFVPLNVGLRMGQGPV